MSKLLVVFVLVASVMVGLFMDASNARDRSLRIATNAPYIPMEYKRPDGTLTGFDIDLGDALCQQMNVPCKWVDSEWDGLIPSLLSHRSDVIMAAMTISPKRAEHVRFSKPYIVVPSAFFVAKDSSIKRISAQSLKGKRIGVQRGTVQDEYVTDTYGNDAKIIRYQRAGDVTVDLEVGRLDAAFFDQITGQQALVKKHPGKYHQVGKSITQPEKYFGKGFGIALRPDDKDLAAKFNRALAALKANGTYAKIYKKYFPESSL